MTQKENLCSELSGQEIDELRIEALAACKDALAEKLHDCFDRFSDEELIDGRAAEAWGEYKGLELYTATDSTAYFKGIEKLDKQRIAEELDYLVKDALSKIETAAAGAPEDARTLFYNKWHY